MIEAVLASLGYPKGIINCKGRMEEDDIEGLNKFIQGTVVSIPTKCGELHSVGGAIVLEEVNLPDPDILQGALGQALVYPYILKVNGYQEYRRHPMTIYFATMNIGTQGSKPLNEALSSRFPEGHILEDISREEFYEMLRKGADVATSQPSPESVMHMWSAMLQEYEELVYIPISSGLSGSCMTAQAMAQEEPYAGRVFVVDNGRVSTPMHRSVLDAVELAEKGYRAQTIKDILEKNRQHMVIYVGLSTLTYLKKGGRISSVAAVAADVLKIKPVMKFGVGKLDVYQKCRGMKNARKAMIDAMKKEFETNFKEAYEAGKLYLMAASSSTAEVTEEWIRQIKESFPGMDVMCDNLSLGLSCHIGPDGLGIACCNKAE